MVDFCGCIAIGLLRFGGACDVDLISIVSDCVCFPGFGWVLFAGCFCGFVF